MFSRRLTLAVLALLVAACPASAADKTLDTGAYGPVSAYGGRVVWSKRDPGTGGYRLRTMEGDAPVDVPVPPRRDEPFDVDLGPGPDGSPVAVYSRCSGTDKALVQDTPYGGGNDERQCRLYLYGFNGPEQRLRVRGAPRASSDFLPSIWKGRLVFARRSERGTALARLRVGLYTADVAGRQRPHRLHSGDAGVFYRDRYGPEGGPGPIHVDLRGRAAAVAWTYRPSGDRTYANSDIRLVSLSDRRALRIATTDSGWVASPVFDSGSVYWLDEYLEGANPSYRSVNRRDESTGRSTGVGAGDLYSIAVDQGRLFGLSDGSIVERTGGLP